jgi:hypothetical protein
MALPTSLTSAMVVVIESILLVAPTLVSLLQ